MESMESMRLRKLSIELLMEEPDEKKRIKLHKENVCLPYDVLRIIFRYFNARDLSSIAMVCRSWLEAANDEECLRGPYAFLHYFMRYFNKTFKYFENEIRNLEHLLYYIKESPIKPFIGFFFAPWKPSIECDIRGGICELLPKNCKAIMLFNKDYKNDEIEYPSVHLPLTMICLLLPQIPNVKINTVELTNATLRRDITKKYMRMIKGVRTQNCGSTCLILFCSHNGYDMGSHIASLAYDDKKIGSLWGGVTGEMQCIDINNQRRSNVKSNVDVIALLITGSIQTWSVVVDGKCETHDQIKEKLNLFKEQVKLQRHSIGFMFACQKYVIHRVEYMMTLFARLFPEVRLIPYFINGANSFGKDTIVDKPNHYLRSQYREKFEDVPDHLLRNDSMAIPPWNDNMPTTSFMILTYI